MINEFQPMNHLSRLQNFICTIGNLPTSYVLSMSYEEQVWWLCNFLETKIFPAIENNTEITEKTQKAFLELQQYVSDYFNNLDVQDEINNKLDEMLEDGSLSTLIFAHDYYKFSSLNVRRIARWIINNGKNNINYQDEAYFANTQGSCMIDNNTIAIAYTPSNTDYTLSNRTLIRIYSLSTGNVLREAEFDFGHANGLIYKDGKLYVTECFRRDNNSNYNYTKNVFVVDVNSLSYIETKVINSVSNDMFLNVSYDSIKQKWYAMQRFVVNELDENFNVINTIQLINNDIVDPGTFQTIHAHNGRFYVLNAYPNQLIVYNENGAIIQYYKLPEWAEDSFFIGEAEDISFIGEDIYLISHKSLCEESDANVTQVFVLNTSINKSIHDTNKTAPISRKRLIVDNNFRLNPDGSSNNGFNELAEAIEYTLSPKGINVSYINISAGSYKWCFINNIKHNIRINGAGATTIVDGISIMYCNNIFLQNMKLKVANNSELGGYNLFLIYTNTKLQSISFDLSNEDYKTIINNSYGTLELYNSTPNNLTDDIVFIRNGILGTLKYRSIINNILSSGNYNNIGWYAVTDELSLQTGDIAKNSFLQQQNVNLNDLIYTNKHIQLKFRDGTNHPQYAEFNTEYSTSNKNFKVQTVEVTADNFYINEMIVHYANGQFSIASNKSIDKNGVQLENPRLILNRIYLLND